MNSRNLCTIAFFIIGFSATKAIAQSTPKAFFGLGLGLDYGGIGIRGEAMPQKHIGLFLGAGYNFVSPAFNAGASYKVLAKGRAQPFVTAMYGYNAALKVQYGFSKDYYGLTTGAGCDLYDADGKRKWVFALLVPFRKQAFHDTYQSLKDAGYEFNPGPLPIAFTIGYNFLVTSKPHKSTKTIKPGV